MDEHQQPAESVIVQISGTAHPTKRLTEMLTEAEPIEQEQEAE